MTQIQPPIGGPPEGESASAGVSSTSRNGVGVMKRGGEDWSPSPPRDSWTAAILAAMREKLPYATHGRIVATPGHGDELAAILQEAAAGLEANPECLLYVVGRAADDPDSVWVTEVWTDHSFHSASLNDPGARALIERARPIIADFADRTEWIPEGGKGLRPTG